jgi:hypothetical protein
MDWIDLAQMAGYFKTGNVRAMALQRIWIIP